ncbi:MAG: DUF1800 family protein [Sulfitobacter sp.]
MSFDPHIAERRFGYGLSPDLAAPAGIDQMLQGLAGPDDAVETFPIPPFEHLQDALVLRRRFAGYARERGDTPEGKEAHEKSRKVVRQIRDERDQWFIHMLLRQTRAPNAFRERLVAFWADHLTAAGTQDLLRAGGPIYVDEAIRPHIAGNFADLLTAAITHPLMLHYLDQNLSAGPGSRAAKRRRRPLGLNENLARELLELHTLGVDGPYNQTDVRELAELLTGMSATRNYSFKFRNRMVEPGTETVLGKTYGPRAGMDPIRAVLRDLAVHPVTARHLATKLAVHFISDTPPAEVIAAIEQAYLRTDGDLMACYAALLEHPDAWSPEARNIRPPMEFMAACLRSLNLPAATLQALEKKDILQIFFDPLELMGQNWARPAGPDGLAEEDDAWITPQGISARMEWTMQVPARLMENLPDPRAFVRTALGENIPPAVAVAAAAAESRAVAIGLILSSPAFQRR